MNEGGDTEFGVRIGAAVEAVGLGPLGEGVARKLAVYVLLILRWNTRVNLTAIREESAIIDCHLIESIYVSEKLPQSVRSLLDFGSGAGLPGIPIAICRPEIRVTLAESQNKKAAFLMEAVRVLGLSSTVYSGRAQELKTQFDCVTLRAVDKMAAAVTAAEALVVPRGWLALMTTESGLDELKAAVGHRFEWSEPEKLPGSDLRLLALGRKRETA
jgi:16S rRNA (guanine527-N7)-methyltransferase